MVTQWSNGTLDVWDATNGEHVPFFRGDPEPAKTLYSHRAGPSLANPFGPVAVGSDKVEETMERAASNYRDGRSTGFEALATYVTPELAYLVEVERFEAKVGGGEEIASGGLRPGGGDLEDRAPARRSHHLSAARRVGD